MRAIALTATYTDSGGSPILVDLRILQLLSPIYHKSQNERET